MLRFVVTLWLLCIAGAAGAQEDPVRAALAGFGCEPVEVLEQGGRWYAACGERGVFVLENRDGRLELAERRRAPGAARSIYARGDRVWVESTHVDAHPLNDLAVEGAVVAPMAAVPVVPAPTALPPPILRPIEPPVESKLFPSRKGGYFALEGSLRPLLPINTRAVAAIAELGVSYVGERHWFAELRGFPLGGIVGEGNDTPLLGVLGQVGYDHPYFAIGLGGGALTRGSWYDEFDSTRQRVISVSERDTRAAISQYARLGPRDGLHFSAQSVFVLRDEWRFGFIELRTQFPLVRGLWLTPAGAGGQEAGFFYAEVGLRKQLYGDRGGRSLFVRPSVGAAGVDKRDGYYGMRAGPMVGFHVEWRK